MFKGSKEINMRASNSSSTQFYLNNNDGIEENFIFGKYQKTPDIIDSSPNNFKNNIFVAPELTEVSKIQLLHFPNGAVRVDSNDSFVIKRNGVKGNFEVILEDPYGCCVDLPLQSLDPERLEASFNLKKDGLYKVHIKCNSVPLPKSPFIMVAIACDEKREGAPVQMPVFRSDPSKVLYRGPDSNVIRKNARNEFVIDGSNAGDDILIVGALGPTGQCDEVTVKHVGKNVYIVSYQVGDPGEYLLAAKWGDDHIPGSPFCFVAQ